MAGLGLSEIIVVLLIPIGVFFLFREVFTWYWKMNEVVKNQKDQTDLLKRQNQLLEQLLATNKEKELM